MERMKFEILEIDPIHDGLGWSWNNWYKMDINLEYIKTNINDKEVIDLLQRKEILTDQAILNKTVSVYDDGYNINVLDLENDNMPIVALCYGKYL